jgi:hypothetical protein
VPTFLPIFVPAFLPAFLFVFNSRPVSALAVPPLKEELPAVGVAKHLQHRCSVAQK